MPAPHPSRESASVHHLPNAAPDHPVNPGVPLDLDMVRQVRVNLSAVERRAATLPTRRTVKKEWQAAWLVRALECIDLTTLSGDDTEGRVERLCAKARKPLRDDIVAALGLGQRPPTVAAVCVYHRFVKAAKAALAGSGIPVAAVSTAFPAGLAPFSTRLAEIEASVADGADEIDVVLPYRHFAAGRVDRPAAVLDVVRRATEGRALMKAILETGELPDLDTVDRAARFAIEHGADFVKTSTGKSPVSATLPAAETMLRVIAGAGRPVGIKPSGGISTADAAAQYLDAAERVMGPGWVSPATFRFGASGLLTALLAAAGAVAGSAGATSSY